MSLEDAVVRSVEAFAGRRMMSICLTALLALTATTLKIVYIDHSKSIAQLSTKMDDVVAAIASHDRIADTSLHDLTDDENKHETRLALAEQKIDRLERQPPIIERDYTPVEPSQRFMPIPVPNPLQSLGNALQHAINPPHHWRERRP